MLLIPFSFLSECQKRSEPKNQSGEETKRCSTQPGLAADEDIEDEEVFEDEEAFEDEEETAPPSCTTSTTTLTTLGTVTETMISHQ